MPRSVVLTHSSGPQGPGEGSGPFAGRLREELGPEHEVHFPIMPDLDEPHYVSWSKRFGEILDGFGAPMVLVGHSLGGSVALKYLDEAGRWDRIAGLVLVATPFWGSSGWEAEWALPEDWPTAAALPPTYLFHSRDDEEIPFSNLDRYAQRIPNAAVSALDGNGHLFDRGDLSEIVDVVRSLARG